MADDEAKKDKLVKKLSMKEGKKGSGKRKGLGGLSPEKKKLLKKLIMQKAQEVMKAEMQQRAKEKDEALKKILEPLRTDGMNKQQLLQKVKELYKKYCDIEEEKYDWEARLRQQDIEIQELTIKCNDVKGKYVKPVLKKVQRTEPKSKDKDENALSGVKSALKSTGNKFAVQDKDTAPKTPDWRESLKPAKENVENESAGATIALGDE